MRVLDSMPNLASMLDFDQNSTGTVEILGDTKYNYSLYRLLLIQKFSIVPINTKWNSTKPLPQEKGCGNGIPPPTHRVLLP